MLKKSTLLLVLITASISVLLGQNEDSQVGKPVLQTQQEYSIAAIGFYNLENLFDTLDTPDVRDEEFTPQGGKRYNTALYQEKLNHLASVIAELGTEKTPHGLALLGVAEIENRSVLEDLTQQPEIADRNYQIAHYDSPDERGIDVGLLYNPTYFQVTNSKALPVKIYRDEERVFTRDVLLVSGLFQGEPLHVFVNHWPSRRGGEAASAPLRNAAALVCKNAIDSLQNIDNQAKVLVVGDLNDDPINDSVQKVLGAKRKTSQVKEGGIYNPMVDYYKRGIGTNAYRDAWSLFDQIMLSESWLDKEQEGYFYYQTEIHNPKYLHQKSGQYKGYPWRTFVGNSYLGGYSDHFPVYVYVVKRQMRTVIETGNAK